MTVVFIIIAYTAICLFELPGLIQNKYWREVVVFSFFLLAAFVLSLLLALGVDLPQIEPFITRAVSSILSLGP